MKMRLFLKFAILNSFLVSFSQSSDIKNYISIPEEFPSYQYVFNSLDIPLDFAYDENFYQFVQKYKKNKRKIYLKMLKNSKDIIFPTLIKGVMDSKANYIFSYVPIIESGLNIKAASRTGALGLWQFTKRTGKYFNLMNNKYVDQRNDPVMSTIMGLKYLKKLEKEYKNNRFMALMSYNAGSGYMKRHSDGIYDLSFLISSRSRVKNETKKYIQKILLMALIGENHRFMFDPEIHYLKNSSQGNFLIRLDFSNLQTFESISKKFKIPIKELRFFNRQFKRKNPNFHFINIPRSYLI